MKGHPVRMRVSLAPAVGVLFVTVTLIGGCFRLSQPAPQVRSYRLDYRPPAVTDTTLPVILRVATLAVAAIYDRESIAYRRGEYSTAFDFYNRWSANPGSMLADLLARDLGASGAYRAVQRSPSLLRSDYQLSGEVEAIEERITDGACSAHLQVRVLLVRVIPGAGDALALQQTYSADKPCTCGDTAALAAAMSEALRTISVQLQHGVYDAIRAELSRAGADMVGAGGVLGPDSVD